MTLPLHGKHAVVTGAGRGIGVAIARALAAQGATVSLIGRDAARLEAVRAELGASHSVHAIDITDETAVRAGFAAIVAAHGRVDILVNNAGQATSAPFAKMTLALLQQMLQVNVLTAMVAARAGRIINIASTAGLVGYGYVSAYVASKHAVVGLTRSLALETAKSGVTVNALCPGYTETDIVADAIANIATKTGKSEAEARASLTASNPQGRLVQPEEVANAALWLCLPGSESITGQAIPIAGGEVMSR
jgi:NAD(P)-dependent dehydrogenase (short-subunit alcohol dehydrogenase family)